MNFLNHFGSLVLATLLIGFVVGILFPQPYATPIAILAGVVLGWNWHKVTGYKLTIGEDR